MQYGEQTKYLSWEFSPKKHDHLELLQITDMQFGSMSCKYDRVIEYRDWVLAEPNRYMLWTGDNIDAGTRVSKGSPFEQHGEPQTQVLKFAEVWAPARHRILGYVGGNHERRGLDTFGDLGTLIATLLKIPYSDGRQQLDIYYGKHVPFKISLWHGVGGARTKGTVAQILDRFMAKGDSQLYLMGHVHQPLILPHWKEVRDEKSRTLKLVKSIGAVGSSFLETWGSYGEVAGYGSSDVLMANTILEPNGKWEVRLR